MNWLFWGMKSSTTDEASYFIGLELGWKTSREILTVAFQSSHLPGRELILNLSSLSRSSGRIKLPGLETQGQRDVELIKT